MNLYETLGVDPAADRASIRRAYRKKARDVHPDTGGDPQKFALVKHAHDVLTDEQRRAKYDATGDDAEQTAPPNPLAEAMGMLSIALDAALDYCYKEKREPNEMAILDMMKSALSNRLTELGKNQENARLGIRANKVLAGRFTTEGDDNLLEAMIANRITTLEDRIRMMDMEKANIRKALDILKVYRFRADKPQYSDTQRQAVGMFFNGIGGF